MNVVLAQQGQNFKLDLTRIPIEDDNHMLSLCTQVRSLIQKLPCPREEYGCVHSGGVAVVDVRFRNVGVDSLNRPIGETLEVGLLSG